MLHVLSASWPYAKILDCVGYLLSSLLSQDDDLIGSIPLEPHLQVRLVSDPKAPPVSHTFIVKVKITKRYALSTNLDTPIQNCFEIFSLSGVIKAWKKDSDGKPVPGMSQYNILM